MSEEDSFVFELGSEEELSILFEKLSILFSPGVKKETEICVTGRILEKKTVRQQIHALCERKYPNVQVDKQILKTAHNNVSEVRISISNKQGKVYPEFSNLTHHQVLLFLKLASLPIDPLLLQHDPDGSMLLYMTKLLDKFSIHCSSNGEVPHHKLISNQLEGFKVLLDMAKKADKDVKFYVDTIMQRVVTDINSTKEYHQFIIDSEARSESQVQIPEKKQETDADNLVDHNLVMPHAKVIKKKGFTPFEKKYGTASNKGSNYLEKPNYAGEYVISIDMCRANFSCLFSNYSDMFFSEEELVGKENFKMNDLWKLFISRYTSSSFLQNSRMFRQMVFGNLNCTLYINLLQHQMMVEIFEDLIAKVDSTSVASKDSPMSLTGYTKMDEIIIYPPADEQVRYFTAINEILAENRLYQVSLYYVKPLLDAQHNSRKYQPVVRELLEEPTKDTKIRSKELKCLPKKWQFQTLKFVMDEPLNEFDQMVLDDNRNLCKAKLDCLWYGNNGKKGGKHP